jgi:queuosine precursor transporter
LAFMAIGSLSGWTMAQTWEVMVHNYWLKVAWEVAMTPITYRVVAFLKRVENEDYYDKNTNFNPFTLKT